MISTVSLFWALCVVCIVNMARYFSSLRALLVVLRGSINMSMAAASLPRMVSPTNRCAWYGISTLSAIAIIMMKNLFAVVNACAASFC